MTQQRSAPDHQHDHRHHAQGAEAHGVPGSDTDAPTDPVEFWQQRYGGVDRVWSGRVNHALRELAADWSPGRSLDLGCGEGGDVLWLAERGWNATGIDLSEHAVARARAAARERGLDTARFIAADLGEWADDPARIDGLDDAPDREGFDLVTASFFQSPVELPRERILRAAARGVAPGGRVVVIAHAAAPDWAPGHGGDFPTPEHDLAVLNLDPNDWDVEVAEVREREGRAPDGASATFLDSIVSVRRR